MLFVHCKEEILSTYDLTFLILLRKSSVLRIFCFSYSQIHLLSKDFFFKGIFAVVDCQADSFRHGFLLRQPFTALPIRWLRLFAEPKLPLLSMIHTAAHQRLPLDRNEPNWYCGIGHDIFITGSRVEPS